MKEPKKACATAALFVLVFAQLLFAQTQPNTRTPVEPPTRPKFRAMMEQINQRSRELGLISVAEDPDQAEFVRRRMAAQLSEDFEKLHSINAEKIAPMTSAPSLDYRIISDATADLKNRANRIKNNVPLLQVASKGEKIRYDENPDDLASKLPELSRLINSFLGSPVFRLSSANDFELRLKASRDLDGIIKLSDVISKVAKRSTKIASNR
ncbi:MAG TPA: hypothetical protein VFB82_24595 [Blastocatellia bacterium]|jgi:hypothetical protein|nr:hypothetical protein [Blastocatellia bacterium]